MNFKKLFSLLLAVCLMLSLLPTASLAVDTSALHNFQTADGYHLFTDLPTAENPTTTADIYWGAPFDGVFHGMTGSGFSSGSIATSTDVAAQNKIAILYGGEDATYGTYYYLTYTLPSGAAYTFAYSGGYFSQNGLTNGLPSGGWAAKHKLFYNAEQHFFFHRPSADMTVMKALKISSSSFKFFTDTVAKVLVAEAYPVRLYTTCTSDNVAGSNTTHQWSGSCIYEGCQTKYDYKEKINIAQAEGYHLLANLPTEDAPVTTGTLYMGSAFDGIFYGMNGTFTSGSTTTTADVAGMSSFTVRYGGNDETYGDYYYLEFTMASGTAYTFAYAGGYFSQNALTNGLPSGGWAAKHKMFYDAQQQLFYHRPSADMTVQKALKISSSSFKFFTDTVDKVLAADAYPVRMYEACASNNVAGKNDTHHWSGVCSCGYKFDYEENYVLETRAPQAGASYFWGVTQLDEEGQGTYFFNSGMFTSSFDTQLDMLSATTVYVDVVDGGYHLYYLGAENAKQYICLGKDASNSYKTYIKIEDDVAAATVFTWNKTYNTFVTSVVKDANGNTVDMVLGAYTSGSTAYTKISGLLLSHLAQAHYFPAQLYVEHLAHEYDVWGYDENSHWKSCFCGKNQEAVAHTLGDMIVENGNIYRKCVCGYATQVGTIPAVDSHYVSLKDNFAISFLVKNLDVDSYKDPYMVFVMKGEETKVTAYQTEDEYCVFTYSNLAPDLMNETITANLYATVAEETVLVSTDEYSVAQYCYDVLRAEDTGDLMRTLLVETLNLGAAAQTYRGNTDALANAELTDAERALGAGELRELVSVRDFGKNDGKVQWYGISLLMGNSIGLRVYFEAEDITDLTIKAGEYTLSHIGTKDGKYYVDFTDVNPAKMNEEITFTAYQGGTAVSTTATYSVESYVAMFVGRKDVSVKQVELAEAVIRYGDAAKAYAERVYDLQEDVLYMGRTYEANDTQWFNWSASGFSVRFQGSGVKATIASNAPNATNYAYLKVYVDGVEQTDILLNKTEQTVVLAEGLNPDEIHTVEVRKRNSPRSSTAGLVSLELLDGAKLEAPAAKDKLIEFIGDSLTVGYSAADVNKSETAWSTKTEDGTKTYSKQVADALNAEYMVTAISGRGVVMNNNNADGYKFPEIYPELDIYNVPGTAYDFTLQPDVVVINLGTNDATNSNLDLTVFQTGVYNFIKTVRSNNPNAQIIWAYGLRNDKKTAEVDAAIQAAVAQVNAEGDSNVHYLHLDLASDMHLSHPTAAAYEPSGEKLIAKIQEITGW